MPDATPTSTAPPSPARRNRGWLVVQIAFTAVIGWFAIRGLAAQWTAFRETPIETLHPRWGLIALSCLVVFATYAVLIETWRRVITAWGEQLSFVDAARIWSLSNLMRYMPGINQVFQIGAIAELSRRRRISPAVAAGAAVINTAVNIGAGFIIALAAGWRALDALSNGHARLGVALIVVLLAGLFSLPIVLPRTVALVRRVTGRELVLGALPMRAAYIAIAGNLVAWVMYGVAFQLFVGGVLGRWAGPTSAYVAVWAVSYVLGYLAFLLPAGIGVREVTMIDALTMLKLATAGPAAVVAFSARLWLTVLELIPALVFLAHGTRARPQEPTPSNGANSPP